MRIESNPVFHHFNKLFKSTGLKIYGHADVQLLALSLLVIKFCYERLSKEDALVEQEIQNIYLAFDRVRACAKVHFFSELRDVCCALDRLYFEGDGGLVETIERFELLTRSKAEAVLDFTSVFEKFIFATNLTHQEVASCFESQLREYYELVGFKGDYTPREVVDLVISLVDPQEGETVYDPVCGTGGFLVAAAAAVSKHLGNNMTFHGEDKTPVLIRIAKWNLFVHSLDAVLSVRDVISDPPYRNNKKFNLVVANPPFSVSNWHPERFYAGGRAIYGLPPKSNADYAFLQYIASCMAANGRAAIIVSSGALSRGGQEKEIRSKFILDGRVSMVVALPARSFKGLSVAANILFLRNNNLPGPIVFVDGAELSGEEVTENISSLRCYVTSGLLPKEKDGILKIADVDAVAKHGYDLRVSTYVIKKTSEKSVADAWAEYRKIESKLSGLQGEMADIIISIKKLQL